MKPKLVAATALGLLTAGGLYAHTRAVRLEAAGGEHVPVLVALRDVDEGEKVGETDLGLRPMPTSFVHPNALTEERAKNAVGRRAASPIRAGQPILARDLRAGNALDRRLAETVPKGQRALSLPVDPPSSLGGAIRVGDRVDLLGTFGRGAEGGQATVALLQDVAVLDTGSAEAGATGHITVALALEEAALVTFGLAHGQVRVVLRATGDRSIHERVPDKTLADILEVERRVAMVRRRTIEQIREPEP